MDVPQLQQFYRQYLQQFSSLSIPSGQFLKDEAIQKCLSARFFNDENFTCASISYQKHTLDRVIKAIESAITDPEEEAVSDALYQYRARLAQAPPDDLTAKKTITYTPPVSFDNTKPPSICSQEAKNIIGAGPSTGFRTWEASLRLACYLHAHQDLVRDKTVLELGAGSGLLSLFCSRVLGARHVITTDGDAGVLTGLEANVEFNRRISSSQATSSDSTSSPASPLAENPRIRWPVARQLYFNDAPTLTAILSSSPSPPDLILGTDITYHLSIIDDLVQTLRQIVDHTHNCKILISSTVRNSDTLSRFLSACEEGGLQVTTIEFDVPDIHEQKGLFHAVSMEIKIFDIQRRI